MSEGGEPLRGTTLLRCGIAAFAVLTLFSGAAQYGEAVHGGPKPLFFILAVVAGAVAILALEPDRPVRALASPLVAWAFLYLLASTAWGLWRPAYDPATTQALVDRFRSMAFLVAMAIVLDDARASTAARAGVVLVAAISSLVNVAETAGAVTYADQLQRIPGRAAFLYVNPNEAGLAIVLGLAAGITVLPRGLRVPALLVAAIGVAATFSRGALVGLAVLVVVLLLRREIAPLPTALASVAAVAALVYEGGLIRTIMDAAGALTTDTLARLAMNADDSGRMALAERAWGRFLESAWVGHGIGITREARTSHNIYLSLATEHGLLGLLAYPALVVALCVRNRSALPTAAVALVAGAINHNLLESEPTLLCFALAAALPAPGAAPAPGSVPRPAPAGACDG